MFEYSQAAQRNQQWKFHYLLVKYYLLNRIQINVSSLIIFPYVRLLVGFSIKCACCNRTCDVFDNNNSRENPR